MINHCYGCGEKISETSAADKKTTRVFCDKCWNKSKDAKVTYKILYKNGIEDTITQTANEYLLKEANENISRSFREGETGVLTLGDGSKEGYVIRIADVSRVIILNN